MAETAARPRKPRRLAIAAGVLAVLVAALALALRHYSRPDTLTALLVDQARSALGTELELGGTGRFEFSPSLQLVLPEPRLREAGAGAALIGARSLEVVAPWRNLWGDRLEIERIDIDGPVIDLDALRAYLGRRPSNAPAADVRFALRVRDGRVLAGGKPIAEGVNLEFANAGDLAAWLAKLRAGDTATALVPPLHGTAAAANVDAGGVRVEGLRVKVDDDAPAGEHR